MELDYVLAYVSLIALLALTLALTNTPSPSSNVNTLLAVVGTAATHPGTRVKVLVYLPKGARIVSVSYTHLTLPTTERV